MTRSTLGLWFFVACLCGIPCRGDDCTNNIVYTTYKCYYSTTCKGAVTVGRPDKGDGPFHYSCTSVDCCQQLFADCDTDGDCADAVLANPEVRKEITDIATTATVLVADCRGRYVVYDPDTRRARIHPADLLEERVLR